MSINPLELKTAAECCLAPDSGLNLRVIWPQSLPSTHEHMRELLKQAPSHDTLWVVGTDAQTKGVGQYQRTWSSTPGDLTLSFALPLSRVHLPGLSIRFALKLAEELTASALRVKWPNDLVYVQGCAPGGSALQKAGGVLTERAGDYVLLSIGLNLTSKPKVSFAKLDTGQTPFELALLCLCALVEESTNSLVPSRFRPFDALYDQHIELKDPFTDALISAGTAKGVASDGALLLELSKGHNRCASNPSPAASSPTKPKHLKACYTGRVHLIHSSV